MQQVEGIYLPGARPSVDRADDALRWSVRLLVATVWISATIFGLYILAFYGGALFDGTVHRWNDVLPGLFQTDRVTATAGVGIHFAAGTLLLILGPVQFIKPIRDRMPSLHRWLGRLYATGALIAGLGGLTFIAINGTIGGTWMNLGFGLYGILMIVASIQAARFARVRRFDEHRAWAIRLFALVIGSWLYRMDYGFWQVMTGGLGHTKTFDGPFDIVMCFFFYIPNLLLAEAFVRARGVNVHRAAKIGAAILLTGATLFLATGTYYFTVAYWGPKILSRIASIHSPQMDLPHARSDTQASIGRASA